MKDLVITFLEMAVVIIIGFILRKKSVVDERSQKTLSEILLNVTLPFTILSSSQCAFSVLMVKSMIAVAGASFAYYLCSLIALSFIIGKTKIPPEEKKVFITTAIFANTGFVGIPLVGSILGDTGSLLATVYNFMYNIFFYSYGAHLLSGKRGSIKDFINPVLLSSLLSVVLFIIPYRVPGFVVDTFELVGNMTIPLSMIILGSTLATVDVKKLLTDIKGYVVCGLRLVLWPSIMMIAIIIVRQFVYISPVTMIALIIMTALPSGTMNVIYCEKYNCAPKFAARVVIMSILIMLITVPILTLIARTYFDH